MASSKLIRFVNSLKGIDNGRKGECTPDKCETLAGEKGGACCKLGCKCLMLSSKSACTIYSVRPGNCIVFPRTPDDLKLVNNCGYYWQ